MLRATDFLRPDASPSSGAGALTSSFSSYKGGVVFSAAMTGYWEDVDEGDGVFRTR